MREPEGSPASVSDARPPAAEPASLRLAPGGRLWEIDGLRGVAIVMMVIYHLMWDLAFFGIVDVDVFSGFWRLFQRATAGLFLLLVGVSLYLRFARAAATHQPAGAVWQRQLRRGATVFGGGLLVTVLTWLFLGQGFVIFGILHLIGASMVLAYPFQRLGAGNIALGVALIALGAAIEPVTVDFPWLLWLGLKPHGFYTVDYFPLLPWFGVVLVGLGLASLAYRDFRRHFALADLSLLPPVRLLRFLGRHSLLIYLVHQPVLIAGLIVLGLVDPGTLV